MSDPAIEAVQRVVDKWGEGRISQWSRAQMCDAVREMAKSVQEQLAVIRERYELVRTQMLAAETSAELSRHASEMTGLQYAYDLIAPTVYPSEELGL